MLIAVEMHILKLKFGYIKTMHHLHIIEIMVQVLAGTNDQSRITLKPSKIRHTLVGNTPVDHSNGVGAMPDGAAPTSSSFLT